MPDKDIWEFVQIGKKISLLQDSDDENEMRNAAPDPTSSEIRNIMKSIRSYLDEGTTDRRGRSHPPQCTTSREDRRIVRMTVTDRSVTSRTVAQHIESLTHHSVSARTIRRRL
ncbi:transposable element Tcb1 transposase [Trichonephila clavipes]|nr:transposable element Tcb1 transposase [Trichonephila clavipes]